MTKSIKNVKYREVHRGVAKKKSKLIEDLSKMDYMTILSGGGNSSVFKHEPLIDYSYKTGITIFDYVYGYEMNVFDDNENFIKKRTILGLQAGSFNVITGRTQSFKTTIACQICANIAYVNNGNIIHYDTEQRLVTQRVKTLTKLPESWFSGEYPRYNFRSGIIGFDTLKTEITELYENKIRNKAVLLKDTGEVDARNKPIYLMPPTVVLIDSLQNVIIKEYDVDTKDFDKTKELRSTTQGARSAYTIRGLITDILPMMKEANIIVICIAHKTSNMSLNPFGGVKKQFQYGKSDERISGGSAVEFNASAVYDLAGIVSKDSRFHIDTDGFEGNTVLFEPTKSSTNESGNKDTGLGFNIIVDKRREGVDNVRTLIEFLKTKGRLKGNKAGYQVLNEANEPISGRFSWRNVYEDFKKDTDTYHTFMKVAKEELEKLIAKAPTDTVGAIDPFDFDKILNTDVV